MSRKRALDERQTEELYHMSLNGFSNADIAKKFNISAQTVGKYYRLAIRERARRNENGVRTVCEHDGAKLTFSVDDGYVGRMEVNGVEETCAFKKGNDDDATKAFDRWIGDMRAEEEFMARVERKQERVEKKEDVIYSIISEGSVGKIFGHYFDFDAAMEEVDRLNDVAEFLGKKGAFDIVEAPVRG